MKKKLNKKLTKNKITLIFSPLLKLIKFLFKTVINVGNIFPINVKLLLNISVYGGKF